MKRHFRLTVVVGELHALVRDTVDVGHAVAHHPFGIRAQVAAADVVAPDHDDVGFFATAAGAGTAKVATATLATNKFNVAANRLISIMSSGFFLARLKKMCADFRASW